MKDFINGLLELFGFEDGIPLYILRAILFYYVSAYIILFVHEMGHFIAACICKKKNIRVTFGYGPGITFKNFKFCILPLGGSTKYKKLTTSNVFILSAGIMAQILLDIGLSFTGNPYVMLFRVINWFIIIENMFPINGHDGQAIGYLLLSKLKEDG